MIAPEARRRLGLALLPQPGLVLVGAFLLVPLVWLFWQSAFDGAGSLSAENFARLGRRVYLSAMSTTLTVSALVTGLCAVLAYPVAYALVHSGPRLQRWITLGITLPFWTSVLVRTYAWMVLLGREGLINQALSGAGLIDSPLTLINNRLGVVIGMVHVMLPFMIFPLATTMRSIDAVYLRAGATCGAGRLRQMTDIYLPLTLPGLTTGVGLVFVLSLGFFITPALLGGGKVIMWSQQISTSLTLHAHYGVASAMGVALLAVTTIVLLIFRWLAASRNVETR